MQVMFGRSARYWFDLARGIDDREVKPNRERKSVGAEDTFAHDISTIEEAASLVLPLVNKVWGVCYQRNLWGKTVTLKIKFSDFEQITRAHSLVAPIKTETELRQALDRLLASNFPPAKPVRLLGVMVSNFILEESSGEDQLLLPMEI